MKNVNPSGLFAIHFFLPNLVFRIAMPLTPVSFLAFLTLVNAIFVAIPEFSPVTPILLLRWNLT